jgi:septum formation protein
MSSKILPPCEYDLLLASASPRRRELLDQIGVRYRVVNPNIDENQRCGETRLDYVQRLALGKSLAGHSMEESDVPALGADTIVCCDQEVFGKPTDAEHFRYMLKTLSQRSHRVLSAVAITDEHKKSVLVAETKVRMRKISDEEIESYWLTGEPIGKAGGYAIQGYGAVFIDHIEGSYTGVVGLPIAETNRLLHDFDVPVWKIGG